MNTLAQDEAVRAYELHIYRDRSRVWCGPITQVSETRGPTNAVFNVAARDVLAYVDDYGHWLSVGYNLSGDLVTIATSILGVDLLTDDPNMSSHIVATPSGITATQAAASESGSVLGEINKLVSLGLRYTTSNRAIYLGGLLGNAFGAPIRLSVDDIAGDVTILHDGTVFANTIFGGSGTASAQTPNGAVPPPDPQLITLGGPEPGWRGRVEHGVSATAGTGGTTGQSAVLAAAQAAYFTGRRPRLVRVADGSVVSPNASVTVPQLIPGTLVKVAGADRFCTWVAQDLQLVRVTGSFDSTGEKIGVSLGPVG